MSVCKCVCEFVYSYVSLCSVRILGETEENLSHLLLSQIWVEALGLNSTHLITVVS